MTNIERLAQIVGGKAVIARLCGVSRSAISKIATRDDGEIPLRYRAVIVHGLRKEVEKRFEDQDDRDLWLKEAIACLPDPICPHCGSPLGGRVL